MKLRSGVYYSDFYLSSGDRIRKSLGTRAKAEAARLEKDLQVRMEAELKGMVQKTPTRASSGAVVPLRRPPCGVTVKEAFRKAKRERREWRESTNFKTIEDNYSFVAEEFGEDADLTVFDRKSCTAYADKLESQGKSGSTINQRLSIISVLLTLGQDWTDGAVEPIRMPRRKPGKARIRVLSRDEEAKALKWCREVCTRPQAVAFHDLIVTLLDTGFRLSEAIGIKSSEVDWDSLKVPAWTTKGDYGTRFVPMTDRVQEILSRRQNQESPFGMFSKDLADDYWEALRKGIGIDPKKDPEFVLHALRHTCASRLAASGMNAFKIKAWMGHKSIKTTEIYVTLFGPDLLEGAEALNVANQKAARRGIKPVPRSVPKGDQ